MKSNRSARLLCALLGSGFAVGALPVHSETAPVPEALLAADPVADRALSPDAVAFKSALQAAIADLPVAERDAIETFYSDRFWAPFWTPGNASLSELTEALDGAGARGLPAGRYDSGALSGIADMPDPGAQADFEAAATMSYLQLAGDMSAGILNPGAVSPEISRNPSRPPAGMLLGRIDEAGSVSAALASVEPQNPDYLRLVAEKARLEELVRSTGWGPEVPDGPTLHAGERDPRVADLRARLAGLGYGAPDLDTAPGAEGAERHEGAARSLFDPALEAEVKRFQHDYGLIDDGVVGSRTLAALNAPAETRLAQVLVNLERMRWMNYDFGERYLLVNIPDFTVALIEDDAPVWSSRVVVGKAHETETQEFSDVVTYMVVNPTWHIPDSIAIRDYLPKLQRDPMVLKRQNIRLLTRGGTEINPKLVDFTQYTPENFPFRIKQRPNDGNALGEVKFMFPNEFSIYLHDTPHGELFARDARAFSNGCIRVAKPVELAHLLLAGQVDDPAGAYAGWRSTGKERRVDLAHPLPVHIVYRTVTFDEAGVARYRADVYDRDAKVFDALEAAGVRLPAAQG